MMRRSPQRRAGAAWLLALVPALAPLLGACASSGKKAPAPDEKERPFVPTPLERSQVGTLMLALDNMLKGWQEAIVRGDQERERKMAGLIHNETNDSFDEVVQALDSDAPALRQTAASALGFSGRPEALSPLTDALSDSDPRVVANALLGLGMLADVRTPVALVASQLRTSADSMVRNNAAYALGRIAQKGAGKESPVLEACRQGLYDEFSGVRGQCASVLGYLDDTDALEDLGGLLQDDEDLVAKPAAVAIASIGLADNGHELGTAARVLVDGMGKTSRNRKAWIRAQLARLNNGKDLGSDLNDWREWAYGLP